MIPTYVNPNDVDLLDWLAGCALMGIIADLGADHIDDEGIAADSYVIAREMLAAREKHMPRAVNLEGDAS